MVVEGVNKYSLKPNINRKVCRGRSWDVPWCRLRTEDDLEAFIDAVHLKRNTPKGCLGLLVNSSSTSKPPCTPLRLSPRLESLSSLDLGTVLPTVLSRAFQMNLRMILIATKGSLLFRPCRLSIEERGKLHLHATQVGQFPAILLGKRSVRTTATPAQQLERPLDGCYQHIGANPCRSVLRCRSLCGSKRQGRDKRQDRCYCASSRPSSC
ncbi:hypothetical protein G7K_4606-t1 [Saitoella complicata NRRL Y-17804]|uniref:Uncharacterized protein n=1 Tax=Saitoella complicata (strain BCRC 22490 / CBS 7301 / JCM 7358 / NBRC 10748 / NRRL Y-17804) TaxID=698492 RepID=A0A0E9NKT1_SAICN|nr:hypothetical protein G7K_4606-t1 [Saitoella complicata NRRL Y-17804]